MARRVALVVLAFNGFFAGAWAAFAPRQFYDSFPGAGHHWVAVDGPYNEHLVRDAGAFFLALGVLALVAAVIGSRDWSIAASVSWLVFSVPHLVYHARHLHHMGTGDAVGEMIALAIPIVAAVVVLLTLPRRALS